MNTIIAEKPSVAREIARIVGATKSKEKNFREQKSRNLWMTDIPALILTDRR